MPIKIDIKTDALSVTLKKGVIERTEKRDEYLIYYDKRGGVVGFELPGAAAASDHVIPLRELVLKAIQHPEERVRDAAVWVGGWLNDHLRAHAKGKAARVHAVEEYRDYVRAIELLLEYYDNEIEDGAEFIDEMRPSPQKSLEILLDRVTHGGYELEVTHVAPPDILARREKIETEIARLLDEARSNFCFHDVLERIYHEEGPEDIEGVIAMFEGVGAQNQLVQQMEDVVAVVNDAWNYFPHAALGGLCPAERT